MAFADPQVVTINAVAQSMPRVSSGTNKGEFRKDDSSCKLTVSHQYNGTRNRRLLRLDFSKIAPDVFTSDNTKYDMTTYLVVEVPVTGFTVAEQKQVVDGLVAYLTASSGAKITQLLGGEN